jgi:hypothetical protein
MSFKCESRSDRISVSNPDPIQSFDDQKLEKIYSKNNLIFFEEKLFLLFPTIYLSLGLYKGRLSYRRSLQLSK